MQFLETAEAFEGDGEGAGKPRRVGSQGEGRGLAREKILRETLFPVPRVVRRTPHWSKETFFGGLISVC